MPHSYGLSFASDHLLGAMILEVINIPKIAANPSKATNITAVQFIAYDSVTLNRLTTWQPKLN